MNAETRRSDSRTSARIRANPRPLAAVGRLLALVALGTALLGLPGAARAQEYHPPALTDTGFDQRLGQQVPLDVPFVDDMGQPVELSALFTGKPVILAIGYYQCPMLCPLVREGLLDSLLQLDFDIGKEFTVINISVDPRESVNDAAATKAVNVQRYGRAGAADSWHFLTGSKESIDRVASAVGFRYAYDEETRQYAHPSGVVVLTPGGVVARYFFGIEFVPRDLRLGLVEASANQIGSPIDQLLLLCYHYDPVTGRYTGLVMTIIRLAGLLTVAALGITLFTLTRRHRTPPLQAAG